MNRISKPLWSSSLVIATIGGTGEIDLHVVCTVYTPKGAY
jgi:hypothetical protein